MELRFGINGAAHLQKNFVAALRSPLRTIYWGRHFVDPSATLDLGMPPGSFIGYDGMSDLEAATFLNGTLAFYHFP
jgi:hypothetical protein